MVVLFVLFASRGLQLLEMLAPFHPGYSLMNGASLNSKDNFIVKAVVFFSLVIIAFYLLTEHRAHLLAYSNYIIFLVFFLMHVFMHVGHGGHGGHGRNRGHSHGEKYMEEEKGTGDAAGDNTTYKHERSREEKKL